MLEQELQLESRLFFYLNGSDSVFWDSFFWLYSYKWTWIPFYLCFLFVFVYRKNWKEIVWTLLAVSLVILLCDQITSGFFKPFFHRFRPTHHPAFQDEVKIIFGYRGGKYGFISGHAANSFGFATFAALLFKNRLLTGTLLLFALINAYSRVYMGVHFISDVVVGALVGAIIGFFVYKLSVWSRKFFFKNDEYPLKKPLYSTGTGYFLCSAYIVMVVVLLLFNNQLVSLLHQ